MIQNQWICLLKNIEEIFRCNKTKRNEKYYQPVVNYKTIFTM